MEIACNRHEAMRYLGYRKQKISENTALLIEETAKEAESLAKGFYCSLAFEIVRENDDIAAKECDFVLKGEDIKKHLAGCEKGIVFCATLGFEIERRIQIYEKNDLTKAVILDCCASAMIETFCDKICDEYAEKLSKDGLYLTSRYSPGYGDFPLSSQKEILRVLNAQRKAGITCNEQFLLFPRKSVTAIMGISKSKHAYEGCGKSKCQNCPMLNCPSRRE